jgi:CDP-6-deoxy-D-xylo-4-hexulose-3-dehydrase
MKELKDKRKHIEEFLCKTKSIYGTIPKFIHTTPDSRSANYSGPTFDDEELIAILDSVLFGSWLSSGESVRRFEKAFSTRFGQAHSLMVNSGSSANLLMIAALKKYFNWQDGDEIILSVVGFPTTLSPLLVNNLKPVFVDIEFDSLNFDIDQIIGEISGKTKAIFISPVLGNPPDFDALVEIAMEYNIELILDNCDSLGSMWKGRYLSDYCVASSCSFYPAHHITTGEGGMISSNNPEIIKIARSMASWGRDCTCIGVDNLLSEGGCHHRFQKWLPGQDIVIDHKYVFTNIGYNLKPLDLQGAIGLAQLEKFTNIRSKRIFFKCLIGETIKTIFPEIRVIDELESASVSWFGVPIICPTKEYKVKLVNHLESNKIQTRNYFAGNILLHDAYCHLDNWNGYPEANKVLERVFFLGCSPNYTMDTVRYIKEIVNQFKP